MDEADLPREMRKLRSMDREEHLHAAEAQGLTKAEARRHTNAEMREHDMLEAAELHTPGTGVPPVLPSKAKPGMPPAREAE
jgi:hypothetical protein